MKSSRKCEIGSNTVLIKNLKNGKSEILDFESDYEVSLSNRKLLDFTCKMFGSSLNGRLEYSREWLRCDYKLPILIDDVRNIILFPLHSIENPNNIWISFNVIEDYKRTSKGIEILLVNGKKIKIAENYTIFENQYIRALQLYRKVEQMKAAISN